MNRYIVIAIVIAVVALGGAFIASRQATVPDIEESGVRDSVGVGADGSSTEPSLGMPVPSMDVNFPVEERQVNPTPVETPIAEPKVMTYTMAEVAKHGDSSSCWSAINGVVYDLTSWISRHPGGEQRILNICGKDGSSAFTGQHEGQPRPEQTLAGFKLGELGN